jgi:hypothetical protein
MRKTLSIIVALTFAACAAVGVAQTASTPFTAPTYYASSFNLWSINGQSPNTYIFQGRSICNGQGQNLNFFDFNTNAPVWIADSNTTNSEVVTPSAIVNTAGSCGVTVAPSHNHYTFTLKSGTAGLQEGINATIGQGAWPTLMILDKNWWTNANQVPGTYATNILGAATGNMTVLIEDITTSPVTFYVWSGTAYTSTNANWKNVAPTLAAGAGAGTSPTVANTNQSTAIVGTANVTTGTATTTGTLFTETWPTVANGGPQYAGSCVVASSGANSYTTFTTAMSSTGSGTTFQRILTVTVATTAPIASTAYSFTYNCK